MAVLHSNQPTTFSRSFIINYMQKFKYSPDVDTPAYIIIHNKVYDIKDLVTQHPGGAVILTHIGRDGTDAFDAFHPESTAGVLADYYVGDIVDDEKHIEQSAFPDEIRKLKEKFADMGLYESNKLYYAMLILINVSLVSLSLALLFLFPNNVPVVLVSASIMGLFWQQCGWLSHDFLHHQVFRNRFYNDCVGYVAGGLAQGFSVSWWKDKHNTHHAQPNVHQEDPDIDTMPLLAWSEHALELFSDFSNETLARFFVNHQAILYFPILAIARVSWAIQSALFVTPYWQKLGKPPISMLEQLSVAMHWVWYIGVLTYALSPVMVLVYFATSQMVCGLLLASVFSLNHNGMPIIGHDEATEMDFYSKQIITGRDVFPSIFVDWFMGGLNFQIEHHLFPNMPRHSLRTIKPIIQDLCEKHNIPHHNTSFWDGTVEVLSRLEEVSKMSRKMAKMAKKEE
ncbi:delta-6 fatty acid desaturase [Paraphysoderma sedebokerense]|nr:delta-6 fatty acid desaturase [Paraphysoderma sedebokerense]